jgi:SpoIID/LytB domain protein
MNRALAVGLKEDSGAVRVRLDGAFRDESGRAYPPGEHSLGVPVTLRPADPERCAFEIADFTIGIGFHWQRQRRAAFRGDLRVIRTREGLTAINDVPLETYVASVIGSEMSAASPDELLGAHAVISRSWLVAQVTPDDGEGTSRRVEETGPGHWRIEAWYGREGHRDFDVCADDHCQRYQGIPGENAGRAARAVSRTAGQYLVFEGEVCDARFHKCCGGMTESYRTAWDDKPVGYLVPVFDGEGPAPRVDERWLSDPGAKAYCNMADTRLLRDVLPGFDLETRDFFRWKVESPKDELSRLVSEKTGIEIGELEGMEPIRRGRSGRIVELEIRGSRAVLNVGKELEIRRLLSSSHLYSSAFVVRDLGNTMLLEGAGWGHGVGLCQIGAAVLADRGWAHTRILEHYYPGATIGSTSGAATR